MKGTSVTKRTMIHERGYKKKSTRKEKKYVVNPLCAVIHWTEERHTGTRFGQLAARPCDPMSAIDWARMFWIAGGH